MQDADHAKGYAFISYSTKNQIAADTLKRIMQDNSIDSWRAPEDIPVGSKYAQIINRAIKDCACFVLLLTNDAQNSFWVAKETERAISYRKPVLPVQLEKLVLNDEFELYIGSDQIVEISQLDPDSDEMKRLIDGIKRYTGSRDQGDRKQNKNQVEPTYILSDRSGIREPIVLKKGLYPVGRDPRKSKIIITNRVTSLIHCILNVTDEGVFVSDLNTRNGTFLNGVRIEPEKEVRVNINDVIAFGEAEFELLADSTVLEPTAEDRI